MNKKYFVGLVTCLLLFGMVGMAMTATIYSESPASTSGDGWSNKKVTDAGDYGYVHGIWGAENRTLSRTFSLSGQQTEVDISFRYWAIDSWDNELAYLSSESTILWDKWNNWQWQPDTQGWENYDGTFPQPWEPAYGNLSGDLARYVDVSLTYQYSGTMLDLTFGANITNGIEDESWAVSNIQISDNSLTPVAPEPSSMLLFSSGIIVIIGNRMRRKKDGLSGDRSP